MPRPEIDPAKTILFIGAGASISLGLPSWDALTDEIGRKLDFHPRIFRLYGDHLALAEYYRIRTGTIGPLRSWMDVEWHRPDIDIGNSKLHELIVKAKFRNLHDEL